MCDIIIVLFVSGVLFAVGNPDNGSCESQRSKDDCLKEKTPFYDGISKCNWVLQDSNPESQYRGYCAFGPSEDDNFIISLSAAAISAIIVIPLGILQSRVIEFVTLSFKEKSESKKQVSSTSLCYRLKTDLKV